MGVVQFEKGAAVGTNGGPPAGEIIRSYAPASGELLGEVPVMSQNEIFAVVERARKAQAAWGVLPVAERCERLLRLRDAIVEHAEELVETITRECGKPRHEALAHEVTIIADLLTHYCRRAPDVLAPRPIDLHLFKHRKSYVHYTPRGVVGVISPWNYPFSIPMGDVVFALITGSAAVLKPSEVTPLTALKAKSIYNGTGLPEDLFAVVTGLGAAGQALIDAGVDKLVFTGGVETGRRVAAACGARLIPCVMELGGKAPLIACADADLERTARAIVYGGFSNAGQACISVERVYAHKDVHAQLVARVKELVGELRVGDPSKDYVDVGAIIFPKQIEIAERHIEDALAKGAELVTGGKKRPGPGQFFEPTVLANCTHEMTVMTEEIFGPIVPFAKVESNEEALSLANASHLGLNAYVFTRDTAKGRALAERIEAGSVVLNDVLVNYGATDAPFGGIKQSGYGRVHGDDALRDMAESRHVNYNRFAGPERDPLWYPYTGKSLGWMMRGVRFLFAGNGIIQRLGKLI
ncbi:aldehyde dehydrogenase family protein [Pendulispora albinea]|uniref:Aldehyde dehydrogenase n=1 Tax=Pendulispora albinea TaxID=2741071 RepID=A0ABZ2LIR0_9BACT